MPIRAALGLCRCPSVDCTVSCGLAADLAIWDPAYSQVKWMSGSPSDVEAKLDNVTIRHDVILALDSYLAGRLRIIH